MPGYCTVDDVASSLPFFQRNAPGSVSDNQIQGWIEDRKARIRSLLLKRGIDPDALTLTADQAAFLRGLNRDGAIGDLGDALQSAVTLQPGEISLAQTHRSTYERVIKEIQQGFHDVLFAKQAVFGGTAGAETEPGETPEDRGENRSFGKDQVF